MTEVSAQFEPKWISPPGDTIADLLIELGWSQIELAKRTEYSLKHVNLLLHGKASITEDTAFRLERVIGGTADFWLSREAKYREAVARVKELESLRNQVDWLKELPLGHMIRYGWISKISNQAQQVLECLKFFSVASVDAWRAKYIEPLRHAAFKSSPKLEKKMPAVAAWLRQGERSVTALECGPFDKKLFKSELNAIRQLTNEPDPTVFVPKLIESCARAGVAVVFEPAPPGCPVTGATKWITSDKALHMLSLRYKTNDHLWFAFFHEAGHLLLHGKKMLFLEGNGGLDGKNEGEADKFSQDFLISPEAAVSLPLVPGAEIAVKEFAEQVGVAPGIIVGRMQHDGILPWNCPNQLKVRYEWSLK